MILLLYVKGYRNSAIQTSTVLSKVTACETSMFIQLYIGFQQDALIS